MFPFIGNLDNIVDTGFFNGDIPDGVHAANFLDQVCGSNFFFEETALVGIAPLRSQRFYSTHAAEQKNLNRKKTTAVKTLVFTAV